MRCTLLTLLLERGIACSFSFFFLRMLVPFLMICHLSFFACA